MRVVMVLRIFLVMVMVVVMYNGVVFDLLLAMLNRLLVLMVRDLMKMMMNKDLHDHRIRLLLHRVFLVAVNSMIKIWL